MYPPGSGGGVERLSTLRGQLMLPLFPRNMTATPLPLVFGPVASPFTSPASPSVSLLPLFNFWFVPVKYTFSPTAYPPGSGPLAFAAKAFSFASQPTNENAFAAKAFSFASQPTNEKGRCIAAFSFKRFERNKIFIFINI